MVHRTHPKPLRMMLRFQRNIKINICYFILKYCVEMTKRMGEIETRDCSDFYYIYKLQCNLDLVTLLVSAKTVTKLHNVTRLI